ncbi:hypothetical protein L9F63_017643, partial [Diploptera punctata]
FIFSWGIYTCGYFILTRGVTASAAETLSFFAGALFVIIGIVFHREGKSVNLFQILGCTFVIIATLTYFEVLRKGVTCLVRKIRGPLNEGSDEIIDIPDFPVTVDPLESVHVRNFNDDEYSERDPHKLYLRNFIIDLKTKVDDDGAQG